MRVKAAATSAATASKGSLVVTLNGVDYDLATLETVRLGFSSGDEIVFTATAPVQGDYSDIGLTRFDVTKYAVAIDTPANGARLSLPAVAANPSLVDMSWSANRWCSRYDVYDGYGNLLASTQGTSVNGVDVGLVALATGAATYNWGVRGYFDCANEGLDNQVAEISALAWSSFVVAASPEYGAMPATVTAYLKLNTGIDCAAREGSVDGVTYSASGLPKGLSINASTGMITGIPKKAGSFSVTVTAANAYGSDSVTFTLKVEKKLKNAKADVQFMLFDGYGNVVGSAALKTNAAGKWTLKTTAANKTVTTKGTVAVTGTGALLVSGSGASVSGTGTGTWSGTIGGYTAYGAPVKKLSGGWTGTWNCGAVSSSDASVAGYVSAKVASGGKIACSGKLYNKANVRSSGYGALLPGWFVSAYLPAWSGRGDVLFVHLYKKNTLNGGLVLFGDGTVGGSFRLGSATYGSIEGSKWNKPSFAALNGATMSTTGGGYVSTGVSASSSKLSAADKKSGATVSAAKNTGVVTVSYTTGKVKWKGKGVLYHSGGVLQALGGGNNGGTGRFSFRIR